jgi:carboxyl-terminal processing protease
MSRTIRPRLLSFLPARAAALAAAALIAGCGGGNGPPLPPVGGTCSVSDQKDWLRDYMNDWYFWYAISPNPSPAGYSSVASYFDALLYTGTDPDFPADRYSNFVSTEDFNRFFGDGQTLSYGVRVAGLEVTGFADEPLYVRYIDPGSPAAAAGLVRGDEVLAINGTPAADLNVSGDYAALSPAGEGDRVTLDLRDATGAERTVTLGADVYAITPVPQRRNTTTVLGRPMGYLQVNDMINQASTPMSSAFSAFRSAGVEELVLDLRYNGGGLVSIANDLASYVAGSRASGDIFASLQYNDKRASANDQIFRFGSFASALGVSRVYVLAGERTCSASEQVINGLRPFVDVVTIGNTTCGKPVGFLPQSYCDTTYSVVNFETANADNEGRYFDGFNATCPVAEDFTQPIGGSTDPLLNAAREFADTNACPAAAAGKRAPLAFSREAKRKVREPGEWGNLGGVMMPR